MPSTVHHKARTPVHEGKDADFHLAVGAGNIPRDGGDGGSKKRDDERHIRPRLQPRVRSA